MHGFIVKDITERYDRAMWNRLKSQTLLDHSRLQVHEDDVQLPSGQIIQYLRFTGRHDGVNIICVKDNQVLVQQEYSHPINATLYQFPGGAIEGDETPEQAAHRELLEESGVKTGLLTKLGFFYLNNRREASRMFVFLATDCQDGFQTQQELEEDITSTWIPIAQFQRMITRGEITTFSMLASWTLFRHTAHK